MREQIQIQRERKTEKERKKEREKIKKDSTKNKKKERDKQRNINSVYCCEYQIESTIAVRLDKKRQTQETGCLFFYLYVCIDIKLSFLIGAIQDFFNKYFYSRPKKPKIEKITIPFLNAPIDLFFGHRCQLSGGGSI